MHNATHAMSKGEFKENTKPVHDEIKQDINRENQSLRLEEEHHKILVKSHNYEETVVEEEFIQDLGRKSYHSAL